jgi:hypothetical protein
MICLLQNEVISDERVRIGVIHYKPHKLTEEQRAQGILLDITEKDLPRPEYRAGFGGELYLNPKTGALWYEYVARPKTQEELLLDICSKLDELITYTKANKA